MHFLHNEDVSELVNRFEERTLTKDEWTHAAHLVVGMFYCYHYPFCVAKNLMRDGIYWLNDAHGTPNTESSGYHETLTVFWLRAVQQFLFDNRGGDTLAVLANKLVATLNDSRLPLTVYSRELLFSVETRMNFVEPDLPSSTNPKFSILLPLQNPA